MKKFYLLFCVLGVALPYWQFLPWLMDHGIDPLLFFQEAAELRIGAFAWLDVIVSAIVLLQFIAYEGRQLKMQRLWMPVAGTLLVGVSLGLPLFLLLREIHIEKQAREKG